MGEGSGAQFPHIGVRDGDEISFGQCRLRFLQTPGHTHESICIVMNDRGDPNRPAALFTGDTLFVGDVGRPDLSPTHTPQQLAELLYRSLHEKLLTLPDETEIFPAHGAGSLCGRQMSSESSSTIGKQRHSNYALLAKSSEDFVHLLIDNLPARPEYFVQEVDLNRRGAAPLSELPPLTALSAPEVLELQHEGAVVVDTRPAMQFAVAHVPGSIHIALTGQYASWAARILGLHTRLIIAAEDPEHVRESQLRLARVGAENVVGYLADGVAGWIKNGFQLDYIPQISVQEFIELPRRHETRQRRISGRARNGRVSRRSHRRVHLDPAWKTGDTYGRAESREAAGGSLQGRLSELHRHQHPAASRFPERRQSDRRVRCLEGRQSPLYRLGGQAAVNLTGKRPSYAHEGIGG